MSDNKNAGLDASSIQEIKIVQADVIKNSGFKPIAKKRNKMVTLVWRAD